MIATNNDSNPGDIYPEDVHPPATLNPWDLVALLLISTTIQTVLDQKVIFVCFPRFVTNVAFLHPDKITQL